MKPHIVHVIGTRPQFPKCAPVYRALEGGREFKQTVIHTGQHYDDVMSKQIIEDTGCHIDLTLPQRTSGGVEVTRQGKIDVLAGWLEMYKPDLVMVYGDCNTSLDAALAAQQVGVKLAHVEAGLRCGDWRMVEEFNRVEIDKRADILYVPSVDAIYNLAREGRAFSDIQFVGNVMADSYRWMWGNTRYILRKNYAVVTLHRLENVDDVDFMHRMMMMLSRIDFTFHFPKHPRVSLPYVPANVKVREPQSYKVFGEMLRECKFVVTDSGGVQEEATLAHTPCLTMRPSTERPITITEGTNALSTPEKLAGQVREIVNGSWKAGSIPIYWDGHASERIACHLREYLSL